MQTREKIRALATLAGAAVGIFALAGVASAQDSVGRTASGTGTAVKDNIGAYDTAQFQKSYVVDLAPITSSWGNVFRIGPVIKSSNASNGSLVTSAFVNATAISSTQLPMEIGGSGGLFFSLWTALGGVNSRGVNTEMLPNGPINDTPESFNLQGSVRQMSVGFIERNSSGATGNAAYQGIMGGQIKLSDADPTRAFVTRIETAANNTVPGPTTASFGLGGADSHGNITIRVDGNGQTSGNPRTIGPTSGQSDNNYVRLDLRLRNLATNWVRWTRTGDGTINDPVDFTVPLCEQSGTDVGRSITDVNTSAPTNVNCPNIAPEQIAGRPILLGSGFDRFFRHESAPATLSATQAHLNAVNTDHRGNCSYTFRNFFPDSVSGTGSFIAFEVTIGRPTGDATSITAFGLGANGAPTGEYLFALPSAADGRGMTDPYGTNPATGASFNTATDFPLPPGAVLPVFFLYQGNTGFAGGSGQAPVAVDPSGRLMVAGTVSANSPPGADPTATDRRNFIAVGRTASTSGPTEWTCAAWATAPLSDADGSAGFGKTIVDAAGNSVGNLTTFADYRISNGGISFVSGQGGPSLSAVAFDSVGNIYFIAPARLTTPAGFERRLCVIRGVRQDSPFGYKLEKVLAEGDLITGPNSGAVYRISGLNLTVTNAATAATGIANGTMWSGATNQETAGGVDRATLATSDTRTLGGLVISASITYDENANGSFADITDQNYQAMLFINGAVAEPALCRADFNGDTFIDPDDLSDFITCFFLDVMNPGTCPAADFNGDGFRDPDDLSDFITLFFLVVGGQPCP